MGCASSNSAPKMENAARRRLSVGHVDNEAGGEGDANATSEEDRGLMTTLTGEDVLKLGPVEGDRKFSIGSETDTGKTSFANKKAVAAGDKADSAQSETGLGYTCRKGLKPESPNQDSWFVMKVDGNFALYGVFDGHGQKGHDVSNYVKDNLPKLILRDQRFKTDEMPKMLEDSFKKMQNLIATADRQKKLSATLSGTTATVVVHDFEKKKLTFAHVADSTCCLATKNGNNLEGKAMTRDHKPDLKDERARIEKAGGRVVFDGYANHRIYAKNGRYPGLNMSRCLGDLLGHSDAGCSCIPEVTEYKIEDNDHVLMLCSDGVWEFMSPQEGADIIKSFPSAQAQKAADVLAKEAWDRWIKQEGGAVVDDITAVLIYLQDVVQASNNA